MGYVHYWTIRDELPPLTSKGISMISNIFRKHADLVQFGCDQAGPPLIENKQMRFNGIAEKGHDTFFWAADKIDFNFCKTAREDYDLVVCLTLLVLRSQYEDKFRLSSDGDSEDWQEAFDEFERLFGVQADKKWLPEVEST